MKPFGRGFHRLVALLAAVVATMLVGVLDIGTAAPVALTGTADNFVTTSGALPPTDVVATMQVNVLPPLTCTVTVSWTASVSPATTGYEVRRVVTLAGSTNAGAPNFVTGSPYVDPAVPLTDALAVVEWQVRTVTDSWTSSWVVATSGNVVPCLL